MHDDQLRSLLRALEDDSPPHPAFADALYERLLLVSRHQRRRRAPMILLAAALLGLLVAGVAIGSSLLRVPEVVEVPPSASAVASVLPAESAPAVESATPVESAAPSASAEPGLAGRVLIASADGLRVRGEPDDTGPVVATLRAGQLMGAVGEVASAGGMRWYEVAIGIRGIAGWVAGGPDGDWLRLVEDGDVAFRCDGCGAAEERIVAITPLGDANIRPLVSGADLRDWTWSPDGTRLAATIDPDGVNFANVAVLDADGSNLLRLGVGYSPLWSPDGSRLAWSTGQEIVVTDESLEPVALDLDLLNPSVASWSPDGTRLAITAYECAECTPGEPIVGDVATSIYIINADGGEPVRITDPNYDTPTSWSADGLELSFLRHDLSGEFPPRAFTVPADGGTPSELLSGAAAYGGFLWSPDGGMVTYASQDGIVVQQADGTGDPISIAPPDGNLVTELHWSPSGRYLLYGTSGDDGGSTLWIVPADGSAPSSQVTPAGTTALQGAWQPVLVALP